jgi:hypothetical protein
MDLSTNDLLITSGDLSIVTGSDAIAQDLQQTLQVWLGEWFLDTTQGIPFKQQILVKNPVIDLVQADIINAALNVPGVTGVTGLELDYNVNNRTLSMSLSATDSNGQTIEAQVSVSLPTNETIQGTVF